jgi:hypothetical protein
VRIGGVVALVTDGRRGVRVRTVTTRVDSGRRKVEV